MKTIAQMIIDNDPLPTGSAIGGDADLRGYPHPLPTGCTIGGYAYLRGYTHPLPTDLKMYGVPGKLLCFKKYALWKSKDGLYYAGCQRGLTAKQCIALSKKWEERGIAEQFIAAILESEK